MTIDEQTATAPELNPLHQHRRRDALLRLARRVGAESDPRAVMSALLDEARRLNGATGGFVGRWDEEHKVIHELLDPLAPEGHAGRTMMLGEGAAGRAAQQHAPIIVNDYQHLADAPRDVRMAGIHAALAAPLQHDGRLLGVVVCVTDVPTKQFTEDDADVLVMLGSVAASTLVELERRQTAQHLRLLTERLDQFVETTSDAITLLDRNMRLIGWNRGAEQLYGWRRDEVLGRLPPNVPDDRLEDSMRLWHSVLNHGQSIANYEDERLTRGGDRVPTLLSMSPMLDENGNVIGMMGIAKDLSAVKAVEQQQRKLSRLAEREALAMDLHDNTIQALHGAVLLLSAVERQTDADLDYMRNAARLAREQLSDAIQQLRHRVLDLDPSSQTGPRLVDGLERLTDQVRSNVRIRVDVDIDKEIEARLTPLQVDQLLGLASEALYNAVRHAGASCLSLSLIRQQHRVLLVVADNGVGFDTTRTSSGHGLANMSARAERLRAHLTVKSTPGAGTEVRLEVPV
ncbi:MAG TPA: GAF domain-containing protein [Chloroflexota bacterium]|jgi:PAS domain S-box-containing protein